MKWTNWSALTINQHDIAIKSGDDVTGDCIGIVVAAGSGSRAKMLPEYNASRTAQYDHLEKQFWPLGGKPVLAHSIDVFQTNPRLKIIIIVASKANLDFVESQFGGKNRYIIQGGATRQESVYAGLQAAEKIDPTAVYVAIHDAARPLLPPGLLDRMLLRIDNDVAGVVPVLPVNDTLSRIDSQHITESIVDRKQIRALQTPQLFWRSLITNLHQRYADDFRFTDDCSLALSANYNIATVLGSHQLLKLTQPEDYAILSGFCDANMKQRQSMPEIRIGNGFDVHKFADRPGPIMLAGVSVDSDRAMLAHSDGDVGLHALCDAIFGALADGDIGHHFPPSDARWRNADSEIFLKFAMGRVHAQNGQIINLDLTIICETPKIQSLRNQMRARIATITGLPVTRIAVKATTTEKLGFTGRGEGIAAQATASILLPDNVGSRLQATRTPS